MGMKNTRHTILENIYKEEEKDDKKRRKTESQGKCSRIRKTKKKMNEIDRKKDNEHN